MFLCQVNKDQLTVDTLTLKGGTFINNVDISGLHTANLSSNANWLMGTDTTTNAVVFNLSGLENTGTITIDGSRGRTWTMGGDIMLENSGTTGSADTALFTLNNNMGLNIGSFLTVQGVKLPADSDRIALFDIGSGSYEFGENTRAGLTTTDGTNYIGELIYEGGIIYIGDLAQDSNWPPPLDTETGYIWSGETVGTSPGGYEHRTLVLGNVWRADGEADNTGWHEQAFNGKNPGVYVDGNAVTFADKNMHGDTVEKDGRVVDIRGKVAPGTIYVTADEYLGSVSNGGEAQLQFAYAFSSADGSGNIADVTDAEGNVIQQTKIVKTGDGLLVLHTADNTFSGGIDVQAGGLYLAEVGATGTGALTFHSDGKWEMPVYSNIGANGNNLGGGGSFKNEQKIGGELMVCYLHSDMHASGYRSPAVSNDIIIAPTADGSGGRFTVSFGTSSFVYSASGDSDINNVPRHWRNLTLNGALMSSGNREDTLVLTGYSSNWLKYHDQSYVTAFTLNEDKKQTSQESNFNGTVVLKNTINTSPLYSNLLETRTAGTVQVMLRGDKLQYAEMDLSRESVTSAELAEMGIYEKDGGVRQTYNSVLVLTGEVGLRGLSAAFRNSGYIFYGAKAEREALCERVFDSDLAQNDEVWHVRTVTNASSTLHIGKNETEENSVYVYSGAMGFAQSYAEPTESHLIWGDGFDEAPTDDNDAFVAQAQNRFHMGLETLSLSKSSNSEQYIHTALLNDISLYDGVLGFNNVELKGNMSITSGANLKLGVTGQVGTEYWDNIEEGTKSEYKTQMGRSYAVSPTSDEIVVHNGKILTIVTQEPAATPGSPDYLPEAAVVDGNVTMSTGSGLYFEVEKVEPWYHEFTDDKSLSDYTALDPLPSGTHGPSGNMLLDVNGTLDLMSDTAEMELRFRGVNFSLSPFSNRLYYLAEADNITVGSVDDSSAFSSRLISLGYGYFGLVDTLDSNNAAHNTNGKDYLVMTVLGDPRHTWSGATELTGGSFEWNSYTDSESTVPMFDYHWKENTAFMNGHVVLFGNLYNPDDWEENKQLTSDESVRVLTSGTIATDKGSTLLDGDSVLLPGTVATTELTLNNLNEKERFNTDYQKVHIGGEVAPLSVIINSEYLDVTDGTSEIVTEDGTNYWFYGEGTIRDANETELSNMFRDYNFDGGEWLTNLEKYGHGTVVITTDNSFSGGTKLYGGKIVMQHSNALGSGNIVMTNGSTLQGNFADDREDESWHGYDGAYIGEGMKTSTVNNVVEVRLNVTDDNTGNDEVDARLANTVDEKMVLSRLDGDAGAVVTLHGYSAPETAEQGMFASDVLHVGDSERPAFTYAVFKVLDTSKFYGTIRMDGNIWGQPEGTDGGKVQLEIMTTDKTDTSTTISTKNWLNTTIDLSIAYGTERTVLALDAIEGAGYPTTQEALINNLNGTGEVRMADGAINSSVVNMSEHNTITLVIEGLRSGTYDGVLGYGDFQRTTEYGTSHRTDIPAVGETCHHYGCGTLGDLNVRKQGAGTTQSVYNAWLNKLEVQGGTFQVQHALLVNTMDSGAGQRIFVGDVKTLNTVYALSIAENGILGMDAKLFNDDGSKYDAWETLKPGVPADNIGWVQLENGSTLTAHTDWYTDTQIDIQRGAAVTINAHNFTPDPYITSSHAEHAHIDANGEAHEHFDHFNSSHIIQMLGKFTGHNVNLTFTNEQISPGANEQELGQSDYMGYIALNDHNQMTGKLRVETQTVLQVLQSNSTEADMNATIDGTDAAIQMVHGHTQYVNNLTVQNDGAMLLGGAEKTSLGSGKSAQQTIDYQTEGVQMSVTHRRNNIGTISKVYTDTTSTDSYYMGGSNALRSNAESVHITVHDATTTTDNYLHDFNLHNSLVELEEQCSVDMGDSVLIDKNSIVYGQGVTHFNDTLYSYSAAAGSLQDFELIAPILMKETAFVSKNTTVEMTMAGDRATYTGTNAYGEQTSIYVVKTDQFQGTNVDNLAGSGLTIMLQQNILSEASKAGADVIAIQIGGNEYRDFSTVNGQFMFENALGNFEMSSSERLMIDFLGHDITSSWIDSATLYELYGIQGSQNMLYIVVPEPATATLSLLALAALAARRRRK
ncbi:MAG: autotransporter-associated beta strand repeat-containing protein [Akkermansia sp.]|nr:autotransporter-associated beta strand repeat-containing protein [Akkermansia sp.]